MKNPYGPKQPSFLQYIVCYVIYVVLAAATVWFALQVRTNLIGMPLLFTGLDYRMVHLLDNVSVILMGLAVLLFIIVMEHLLRTRLQKNKFWPMVARIVAFDVIVIAFSYAGNFVLMKILLHT